MRLASKTIQRTEDCSGKNNLIGIDDPHVAHPTVRAYAHIYSLIRHELSFRDHHPTATLKSHLVDGLLNSGGIDGDPVGNRPVLRDGYFYGFRLGETEKARHEVGQAQKFHYRLLANGRLAEKAPAIPSFVFSMVLFSEEWSGIGRFLTRRHIPPSCFRCAEV